MEFKDNLKQLRTKNGMTQAQLAEKLFVSRSTVAKWENGLGLPNPESMDALQKLFGINAQEIATKEPEIVIVEKNRKLRRAAGIIGAVIFVALLALISYISFETASGKYGFTADMAAGVYADREYIDTGDYRIYYFIFEGNDLETGEYWSDLQGWKIIKKHFWGCTVASKDSMEQIIAKDNYIVGRLYSIKGKNGYYNILRKAKNYKTEKPGDPLIWNIPQELISATSIMIDGVEYALQDGFFFITKEPVLYFEINGEWYDTIE